MTIWIWLYVLIGVAATVMSAVATPICRRLAWKYGFLDRPLGEKHKQHDQATPLLGGLAMLLAWLGTLGAGIAGALMLRPVLPPDVATLVNGFAVSEVRTVLATIAGGALFLSVMGLWDDRRPMGPGLKLALQIVLCALVALHPRLRVTLFWDNQLVSWAITLGWFIFIVNAFNFFDNMDGLAAGVAFIASAMFCVVGGYRGQHFVAGLGAVTAGVSLGFYFFNRAKASIFMGDSGSHFLGFLLAVQGVLTHFYLADSPTPAPVFIPLFILALPIFDTFAVVAIRLHQGRPIYQGDHNHISHRFLRMGVSPRTAVILVHLLSFALGLSALPLLQVRGNMVIFIFLQAAAMLALISILHLHGSDDAETK